MNEQIKQLVETIAPSTLTQAGILFGNGGAETAANVMKRIVRDKDAYRRGCEIDDLLTSDQSLESSTQLWGSSEYPDTCLQITISPDGSPKEPRLTWALEEGRMNAFKLTAAPSENDPDGVLGLADATLGTPLNARCVDAALSPSVFTEGLVLNGWINMYVSQLCSLVCDKEGEEGAYGLVCEADNPACTTVSGRIWDVERVEVAGISLTHITVDIVPMGDCGTTFVHLFLHDDVLGEHKPADGDYISCRGVLYFNPDFLEKPKEEKDLRTIKDIHSYLRYEMDLAYCIDMDGDTRLDYNDGFNICMSFKDDDVNDLNSGSQSNVRLGAVRLFSQLRSHADADKISELCNDINRRLIAKAYYSRGRVIVEHYLLPDGSPIPSHMFEFIYRRFAQDVHWIYYQIIDLEMDPDDDDDLDLDDLDDLDDLELDDAEPSPGDVTAIEPKMTELDAAPPATTQTEGEPKPDQPQA